MILSNTLYNKNKNQIFTITHTMFNAILDAVVLVSIANEAITFSIISTTCNSIEIRVCLKNFSYLQSSRSFASITSIYHFLFTIWRLISCNIIIILCTHQTQVTSEYATTKNRNIRSYFDE